MRRLVVALTVLGACLLIASPVAARPPTKEQNDHPDQSFAAMEVCDFPVLLVYDAYDKSITFDRRDGRVRQNLSGRLLVTITNLSTGASTERKISGPGQVTITDAGHVVFSSGGSSLLWTFDGDVTGRGLSYVIGPLEAETDENGFFLVRVDLPPHVEDLCQTLSAP
jgi:hypothetical protein